MFKSEEELREFIADNTPIAVYSDKVKKHVCPFTSYKMQQEVINCLTERLWEKQLETEIIDHAVRVAEIMDEDLCVCLQPNGVCHCSNCNKPIYR